MADILGVIEMDSAERIGVVLARGGQRERDGMIGAHAGAGIDEVGVAAAEQDTAFGCA